MNKWDQLASQESITKTIEALRANGIDAKFVETGEQSKEEVLKIIPEGAEVFNETSVTLDAIGSVHAVTEEGHIIIASQTGSQLSAYAAGAQHVIWVVGTQKIVKNTEQGLKRIYEYVLPLEDERAKKAYGVGSGVSKLLIINKEKTPDRLTLILVNEVLGF